MRRSEDDRALSAELLRHGLREVDAAYRDHNLGLFGGKLRKPVLEWSSSEREFGAWVREARALRLSASLLERPWGELVEVLKHEMAHQYVDEVLGITDEGPHGPAFREVCAARGIDARPSGAPVVAGDTTSPSSASLLARIAGLLSLSKSDNQNEAEAAAVAARRLMLKYNLELHESSPARAYSFRHVGEPTGRRVAYQRVLATILSDFFFVEVLIVPVYRPFERKRGSVLELMGRVENLEMASYVHDFLERAAAALWKEHKRRQGLRLDRDRQSFLFGVMSGFRDKLRAEAKKAQGEGLIWVGDPELARYSRSRHPHVRRVGSSGSVRKEAFSAGHEAGRSLVLSRGMGQGPSAGAPRLLGGRKA